MNDVCNIDLETRSDVDLKTAGVYCYFESPHAKVLIACYSINKSPVKVWTFGRPCPDDLAAHIRAGKPLRAWNAGFERQGLNVLADRENWPRPRLEQFYDTAVESAAMSLPRSLDRAGDALGINAAKDKRGAKLIKLFSVPAAPGPIWNEPADHPAEFAEFVAYCQQDVRAEMEIASRLIPLSDAEMRVYWLNERINDKGLRIDVASARAALRLIDKAKAKINEELAVVTSGAVTAVTQAARLKAWCEAQGVAMPSMDKDDVDEFLHDGDIPGVVRRALELRAEGAKPSVDKIAAMLGRVNSDSRARGVYLDHGAGQTGRFCVAGDTLVDTPTGRRYIVDLREGDSVTTHRGQIGKVTALIFKGQDQLFRLTGPRGETVEATLKHRVMTESGWRRIDECFQETSVGCYALREGCAPISYFDDDDRPDRGIIQVDAAHSRSDPETRFVRGRAQTSSWGQSLSVEMRRGEPDVRSENCGGTYFAEGRSGSLERRGLHVRASDRRCEIIANTGIGGASGSASHRRRQDEQRPGQSGRGDEARTPASSQAAVWSLVPVGEGEVWDISVAGDASYVAQGLAHHNSSRGVQAHNMPKYRKIFEDAHINQDTLFKLIRSEELDALSDLYGEELGRPLHLLSDAVRGFIWASPGHELLVADYSSIEGRLAAWFAGEEWKTEAYRALDRGEGHGIYELAAAGIYNVPVAAVIKSQRQTGKVAELSCQYQTGVGGIRKFARQNKIKLAGIYEPIWAAADSDAREYADKRFAQRVKAHDPNCTLGREAWIAAELIKVGWRAKHLMIVAMWKALEEAAVNAVNNPGQKFEVSRPGANSPACTYLVRQGFLWCLLPSGRALAYGAPKMAMTEAPWADKTLEEVKREKKMSLTVRGVDPQSERWVRFPVYGGSLFNNLVQGTARDILVHGLLATEEKYGTPTGHTHDEIFVEVPRGSADVAEYEDLLSELPAWCGGLPTRAAGFLSKRYKKG